MERGLFEGHIKIAQGTQNDEAFMAYIESQALRFVSQRNGTNLSQMIFNRRKECDPMDMTQVDFAVYADFPE